MKRKLLSTHFYISALDTFAEMQKCKNETTKVAINSP